MSIRILIERDLNRFWKYKWWVTGIIVTNLSDLLIMSLIFSNIVRKEFVPEYLKFTAPGVTMMALFISAFSIGREAAQEIRRRYHHYLLTLPYNDWELALGKILAGMIRGIIYALPFLLLTFIIVGIPSPIGLLVILGVVAVTSLSMSSYGIALSALVEKIDIYVTVRSLSYYLIFFFSTIFYPEDALKHLTQINAAYSIVLEISRVNPISIAAEIIRNTVGIAQAAQSNIPLFIILNLIITVLGITVYIRALRKK
ncbi:MAG: ABC transporter permease [archaeon GB-1867-035]|nr:ABC transporter permease [Candidatus Culexmicrobium profundum]